MKSNIPPTEVFGHRPKEAARLLACGLTTIYNLMGQRKLIAKKLGCCTVITAESLRAYIAGLPDAAIKNT